MISIEPLSAHLAAHFKTVRLTALKDAPTAFGSTYQKESQTPDQDWLKRASTWNSGRSVCYIAMDEDAACGIVAGKCDDNRAQQAWLMSMWVAPAYRRTGLGARLVNAVEQWARNQGVTELRLMAVSTNVGAMRFYERCGFAMTGRTEPYPNDPALFEYEMAKSLADASTH
jgi:GNAT superfamily N-acetyltransferase